MAMKQGLIGGGLLTLGAVAGVFMALSSPPETAKADGDKTEAAASENADGTDASETETDAPATEGLPEDFGR